MRSTGSGKKKNGDGESSRKQTKKCCGAADDGGERKSDDDAATPKKRNRKELRAPLATVTAAIGGANKLRSHTHRKGRKNERDSTGIRVEGGVGFAGLMLLLQRTPFLVLSVITCNSWERVSST